MTDDAFVQAIRGKAERLTPGRQVVTVPIITPEVYYLDCSYLLDKLAEAERLGMIRSAEIIKELHRIDTNRPFWEYTAAIRAEAAKLGEGSKDESSNG